VRSGRLAGLRLLATVVLVTASCSAPTDRGGARTAQSPMVGHVHGLGVDPADGVLYVAGHFGLFRVDDRELVRVAGRWQDTMAFTVSGPRTFLASGHPDLREDLPVHLGLIESTDRGRTWRPLSLQGRADFHALEVSGQRLYAFDSRTRRIMTTVDRRTWRTIADGAYVDLTVLPSGRDSVLATTPSQDVVRVSRAEGVRPVRTAPPMMWLSAFGRRTLVGASTDGRIYVADDEGAYWQPAGRVAGTSTALDASGPTWYLATEERIYGSTDHGRTWEEIVQMEPGTTH
jgi:hypothetical protein